MSVYISIIYTINILSLTTFSPNVLINREQCATMLSRAIKAIAPNADYRMTGFYTTEQCMCKML